MIVEQVTQGDPEVSIGDHLAIKEPDQIALEMTLRGPPRAAPAPILLHY